jgi:hypothetical protein
MKSLAVLGALTVSLAACAQSDIVTYRFQALDLACVHKAILNQLTDHDWTVTDTTPPQIVARKAAPPWLNTAVLTAYFEPPQVTMKVTLVPAGPDVKVVLEAGAIIDPRPGKEKVEPIAPTAQMDAALRGSANRIKQECAASP